MMLLQNFVFFIYLLEILPIINAGPLIDSKLLESCNNEGDLRGDCKQSTFCYCYLNKWLCSFDVEQVLEPTKKFEDLCQPYVHLNITILKSLYDESTKSEVDVCNTTRPCQNNGTCAITTGTSSGYNCSCTDGWEGINCAADIDECVNNPCNNSNSCINTVGSYLCLCHSGWTGRACYEDINECIEDTQCYNNGTCINTPGSYTCNCTPGWEGSKCETDVNECMDITVTNGECINTAGSFLYLCKAGWTGKRCEEDINECADAMNDVTNESSLCYNNGSCINTQGSYRCNCTLGWEGLKCETDVNECVNTTVCNNECINTPGSFWCLCAAGWTGEHCDQDIDECTTGIHNPCPDKGTCINTNGSFWYNCTTGWEGVPNSYYMTFASRIEYWNNPENRQRQLETLNSTLKQLKNNLTIDKTEITSSRIKRTSAPDPRQSAAITGYLGASVLSFVFGLLLCLDLTLCFRRSAD